MAWYDEAVFYHIYPLGLCDAPKQNDYGEPVHRLPRLLPWIDHIRRLGFTALYIGPLFQSVGHGYETTDYRVLDARLGTNEDLKEFVSACHAAGIRVIFDGVFNHTGRDFFAFKDLQANRENSPYRDWYCNVNFGGDNEYHDGFSYDNWGGYNLLVKLNQWNPAVRDYICDVIRFWVSEFDVDGLRLDAADVLDFEFMKALRRTADEVKPDFWLMGEVIHGDYSRWANEHTLHSVTDYALHKALYSSHNDHNYFELAHTVTRTRGMIPEHIRLYNFVDNHDVERISTKLANKAHLEPVHILLYMLPGIPSVYYGSEFGIEGRKEPHSDDSLRPYIDLEAHADDYEKNPCTALIAALGEIHGAWKQTLAYGDYRQLLLTNQQFAFARDALIVAVNNSEEEAGFDLEAGGAEAYVGLLHGGRIESISGRLQFSLPGCSGEIYAPEADRARKGEETYGVTEKDKMLQQKLYDANYDEELERERIRCKRLCQEYNSLPIDRIDERREFIRSILGETGKNVHIEPDFWCDYGYRIKVGENFYANHGLTILDAGGVTFGHDVFIAPSCGFHTAGHPIDFERRNQGLEYAYPIVVGDNVWIGAGVQVMPGVTIGSNVVIGGGSVVVEDIPSDSVAVGNPCRVIRQITDEDAKKSWDR